MPDEPLVIGTRLELLVDHHLIQSLKNCRLDLQSPCDEGVVLTLEKPWEGRFSGYFTVIKDETLYRLYYRGFPKITAGYSDGDPNEVTCYAESTDGVHWTKPNLGLFEWDGSKDNNIILDNSFAPACTNFCPFLDTKPGVPAEERFKALGGVFNQRIPPDPSYARREGLKAYVSGDGIRWRQWRSTAVIRPEHHLHEVVDAAQTSAFWSETEGCYVAYLRMWRTDPTDAPPEAEAWPGNRRWVCRTTSSDFLNWTKMEPMSDDGAPIENIYLSQTAPYFRARHIYLALAGRYVAGRRLLNDEEVAVADVDNTQLDATSDVVLMTTRGALSYKRCFMEGFVRPRIGLENWTARSNFPALNMVPTGAYEMSLYIQQHYAQPSTCLRRLVLRLDGLVALGAPHSGGEMITKPIIFSGDRMVINYSTSAAGRIRIEFRDEQDRVVSGFGLVDCCEIVGNHIERIVVWSGGADLSSLASKPVVVRFVLEDAQLFSFRFTFAESTTATVRRALSASTDRPVLQ
jgi:hypothetical protein